MSDDLVQTGLTVGGSVLSGGGIAAFVIRFLFADVGKRLDKIEKTLEDAEKHHASRHESMVERMARVESKADAAHRRLDELPRSRKR